MSCINFPPIGYDDKGVLYKLSFESGHYYYGVTRNSIRQRYGTFSSVKCGSNPTLRNAIKKLSFEVEVLASGLKVPELKELESLIVNRELLSDPKCLNKCLGGVIAPKGFKFPHERIVKLVDPEGKVHTFDSYKEAAKVIGVSAGSISCMMRRHYYDGEKPFKYWNYPKSLRGWHPVGGRANKVFEPKEITFIKNGVSKTWSSQIKCCKEIGASIQNVSAVALGKRAAVKGWMSSEHIDKFARAMCIETGIKYRSVTDAAKHLYPEKNIRTVCAYFDKGRNNPTTIRKINQ